MTTIWIPLLFTAIFGLAAWQDYHEDWEKIKQEWRAHYMRILLTLAIKPGLVIACVWGLWFLCK